MVVASAITIPYLLALLIEGRDFVFLGFLINPIDGASYLAKMYQGWTGAWQFQLPFTAHPGAGAYLFLYYLLLGHIARWLGLSLILTYHLARLVGAGMLLYAIARFYDIIFIGRADLYKIAFWLTALGSGMGWTIVLMGALPSDFWIAEAYPFLSMFSNPHFPLGLALMVGSFSLLIEDPVKWRLARLMLNGLLLSVILPFALVITLLVGGVWSIWTLWDRRVFYWQPVVSLGVVGGPMILYEYWAALTNPALAVWNAQNLTPSPPVWDFILSFSPALLLAPFGIYALVKLRQKSYAPVLVAWLGLSILLTFLPTPLQRRFMLGFYIPAAILAVFGLDFLRNHLSSRSNWLIPITFSLALPTNLLLIVMGAAGAFSHSPQLYLSQDEARALAWIRTDTPSQSIILASPEMGRWIPAETGRRVIYGHPFETVNAAQEALRVETFFHAEGRIDVSTGLFTDPGVNYLMYGPRERALGGNLDLSALPLMFESGSVRVYQITRQP